MLGSPWMRRVTPYMVIGGPEEQVAILVVGFQWCRFSGIPQVFKGPLLREADQPFAPD